MDIVRPVDTIPFRILEDKRPTSDPVVRVDSFTIPTTTERETTLRTIEVPLEGIMVPGAPSAEDYIIVKDTLGVTFTIVDTISPPGHLSSYQIRVDDDTYRFGYIGFSPDDAGKTVTIEYWGRGSLVAAADVNELADGSLVFDGAIRPRHIFQGGTGPDGETGTSDFVFATNVSVGATLEVGGNLNVTGDLNITGVVNKSVAEILDITDDILMLNSGQGQGHSGPNVGLEVDRGGDNPMFIWRESDDAWTMLGQTGAELLSISDNKTLKIYGNEFYTEGLFKPTGFTADPSPLTVGMVPGIFYNSTDRQFKGIVDDGFGGAKIVILG